MDVHKSDRAAVEPRPDKSGGGISTMIQANTPGQGPPSRIPDPQVRAICGRFESAWRSGSRPLIERILAEVPEPFGSVLLRELVSLELRLRTEGGDTPTIPDYEERFPEQKTLIETLFHELT